MRPFEKIINQGLHESVKDSYTSVTLEQIENKSKKSRIMISVLRYIAIITCLGIFTILGMNYFYMSSTKSISNENTLGISQSDTSDQLAVTLITKDKDLNIWNISITPYKKNNNWVCDIVVENISNVTAEKVSYKIGGASVKMNNVESHSHFGIGAYPLKTSDNIVISIDWCSNGKEFRGKAVYQVK